MIKIGENGSGNTGDMYLIIFLDLAGDLSVRATERVTSGHVHLNKIETGKEEDPLPTLYGGKNLLDPIFSTP